MKKNPGFMITVAAVMVLMMIGAGCASKKHLLKIEQQGAEIQQSQERIAELQRNNEILTGTLNETKASLVKAEENRSEADKQITALNSDVSALQSRNEDLSKSMEALNKENEGKVRRLNGQIYSLRKQQTEKDEQIAAKDGEIASLKSLQASLEGTVAARDQQISRLNEEKAAEAAASAKTISGKNLRITILGVLLALAIIVAVYALLKRKKRS